MTVSKLGVDDLAARLQNRPPGKTPAHLEKFDIGKFPSFSPPTAPKVPQRPLVERFHFRKWIHRTNNSDIALVTGQVDSGPKALKIHKSEDTFLAEKTAYDRLAQAGVSDTGAVVKCYGWSKVTPKSFYHCDPPTCAGNAEGDLRNGLGARQRNPFLPARTRSPHDKATYSWENPKEKQMRDEGIDFRPPSVHESWFWVFDNSQFDSDEELCLPSGEDLAEERYALLLEFLPTARMIDEVPADRKIALRALAGAYSIQQALVKHGDQAERNILVTKEGRVVWIDFDRAEVLNKMTDASLMRFKSDLIEVYRMLFVFEKLELKNVTDARSSEASTLARRT